MTKASVQFSLGVGSFFFSMLFAMLPTQAQPGLSQRGKVQAAMKKAASFYRNDVATHGGYVYYYSLDLNNRWGEGVATKDQVWVQPPGTPTVGLAFLAAYKATGDRFYLDAATSAAESLVYGQLRSGGWTNCVDFDPRGDKVADYRNGKGRGKNHSSLDDGQTESALRLMMNVDHAHGFQNESIHQSAILGLNALLKAQYPNGAFPQVWTGPVSKHPIVAASYPEYDWRTEGRIKEYWNMYTLNDNVCGYVADTLLDAFRIYGEKRYSESLRKLGDFLVLSQMPEPQRGWAQQYNYAMKPIWARKFEPPGVSGAETQDVIETLMKIAVATKEVKYLKPVPAALNYLRKSLLSDGRLARYYELKTNRPLYMQRRGQRYELTYDDANLPAHYGWKWDSRINELESQYQRIKRGDAQKTASGDASEVQRILQALDSRGRWVSIYDGKRLVGQPKMQIGEKHLSSEVFSSNLMTLARSLDGG